MKRIHYISILIFAFILIVGLTLFFVFSSKHRKTSDALRAIPADAAIVVKSNNIAQFVQELKGNTFWGAIENFKIVGKTNQFLDYVQKLRVESSEFDMIISSNQVFMSVHTVGNGVPEVLFTANLPSHVSPSDILNLVKSQCADKYSATHKDYNGATIYTYTEKVGEPKSMFSIANHLGVVMYSNSIFLVESALGQLTSTTSLLEDRGFAEALRTSGNKVMLNVLVNQTRLPSLLTLQVHQKQRDNLKQLASTAQWCELDLTIKDDAFYLNGFAQVADSVNSYYQVFTNQKPVKIGVTKVLPAQTAVLIFQGISKLDTYLASFKAYLAGQRKQANYNQRLNAFSREVGSDITKLYTSFFGNELALAFVPFDGESVASCWYVLAEVKSQSLAKQEMLNLIDVFAKKNGKKPSSFESTFKIDREKSAKIYRFPQSGMHKTLFGELYSSCNDQYFTFIDNFIVFGASTEALSRLILANIHNKQLAVDRSFIEFSQTLSSESNFTAYINPARAEMLFGQLLTPSTAASLLSRIETVQKIQGMALQLTGGKNMVFNNIVARYTPVAFDAPQTVWETRLDTTFTMKPQLVINHNTKNREVFVQDDKHNIYLINEVGRVLWKRPLHEKIYGEVNQVDIMRNGKLQFLFNTQTKLYLIDRNGNNVTKFPVLFRSPATNPVAVFDYEGKRDYRFFIAGQDRSIQVYNRSGNLVTGWEFERTEKIVLQPIKYFKIAGSEHIVVTDGNRPYLLDRKGVEKAKPTLHLPRAKNSNIALDNSNPSNPTFVTTDSLGVIRRISLDGKVESKVVKRVSPDHFFDFQDVDADGKNDYIFLDQKELTVINMQDKVLFSIKFKEELIPQVIYFNFGAKDRKLGVTTLESSQIYLINSNGSFYKGFPLFGSTPFSIGRFSNTKSTFNLMVGSSAGYVLNYAVQ